MIPENCGTISLAQNSMFFNQGEKRFLALYVGCLKKFFTQESLDVYQTKQMSFPQYSRVRGNFGKTFPRKGTYKV